MSIKPLVLFPSVIGARLPVRRTSALATSLWLLLLVWFISFPSFIPISLPLLSAGATSGLFISFLVFIPISLPLLSVGATSILLISFSPLFLSLSLSPSPLCRCDIYLILFPLHDAIPRRWRRMNTYATSSISCCESVMGNIPPVWMQGLSWDESVKGACRLYKINSYWLWRSRDFIHCPTKCLVSLLLLLSFIHSFIRLFIHSFFLSFLSCSFFLSFSHSLFICLFIFPLSLSWMNEWMNEFIYSFFLPSSLLSFRYWQPALDPGRAIETAKRNTRFPDWTGDWRTSSVTRSITSMLNIQGHDLHTKRRRNCHVSLTPRRVYFQ